IDGKNYVYVISNGRAKQREVQLGLTTPILLEVVSGLNEGEMIAASNIKKLEDKIKVSIIK
ncbi:MAG: RND transporter, partial [Candidatus Margulisiibacteriota bacterium]